MDNNNSPVPVLDINIPHRTYLSIKLYVNSGFLPMKIFGEIKGDAIEEKGGLLDEEIETIKRNLGVYHID